jgi:hypothetical protein
MIRRIQHVRWPDQQLSGRPVAIGILAALGLLAFYVGTITLAQSWEHALQQFSDDRWYIVTLVTGFGTQVGLFTRLRAMHRFHHQTQAHHVGEAGGVAVSTGTSTAAMLACCAHHLADVFAVLGIAGAAAMLDTYKAPLLWLGIGMNAAGVAYLYRQVRLAGRISCHPNYPTAAARAA